MSWKYSYRDERKGSKLTALCIGICVVGVAFLVERTFTLGDIFLTTTPKKALTLMELTNLVFFPLTVFLGTSLRIVVILFGIDIYIFAFGLLFLLFIPLTIYLFEELDRLYQIRLRLNSFLRRD